MTLRLIYTGFFLISTRLLPETQGRRGIRPLPAGLGEDQDKDNEKSDYLLFPNLNLNVLLNVIAKSNATRRSHDLLEEAPVFPMLPRVNGVYYTSDACK